MNDEPIILESDSIEVTKALGKQLAKIIEPGDIILLTGDLGAGKTTLTQAIVSALGIDRSITSPSFTLMKEYRGSKFTVYHFDAYRLKNIQEFSDIGYRDWLFGRGVSIIEWGDKVRSLVGEDFLLIDIRFIDENVREFLISGHGETWHRRLSRHKI